MESDRSEYVAPKFWLKKDDKFIAERPVTCVMLEDHYVTKLESEESEFLESASIQSDQQFGKMYSKVDFEMQESRRLNNKVVPWIWAIE